MRGGFGQPQKALHAPADGTVIVDNGIEGAFVTAGTQLAVAYDLSKIFVTVRIDETAIGGVHLDQPVDLTVDAYPHVGFTGYVREIHSGTTELFSKSPRDNTSGHFQPVTQWVPVKIVITDRKNLSLVPGMNATVKIHKD